MLANTWVARQSLTKREKASLNSETCSSVNESACQRAWSQHYSRPIAIYVFVAFHHRWFVLLAGSSGVAAQARWGWDGVRRRDIVPYWVCGEVSGSVGFEVSGGWRRVVLGMVIVLRIEANNRGRRHPKAGWPRSGCSFSQGRGPSFPFPEQPYGCLRQHAHVSVADHMSLPSIHPLIT